MTNPNPRGGPPLKNRNARKSGHYALESSLRRHGFGVLTRRQRETVAEWRSAIEADAGGVNQLSRLKQFQVERFLITEVLIQSLDSYLLKEKTLICGRKKSEKDVIPALLSRNRLAETSLKLATAIGLDCRERPTESLADIIAKYDRSDAEAVPASKPNQSSPDASQQVLASTSQEGAPSDKPTSTDSTTSNEKGD